MIPGSSGWPVFRICGIDITSDFPFSTNLHCLNAQPRLKFSQTAESLSILETGSISPNYSRTFLSSDITEFSFYRLKNCDVLRFAGLVDFYIYDDQILFHSKIPDRLVDVEILFLSTVLSFWLEKNGIITLHASAISYKNMVASFFAHSGNGKSTLAASFLQVGGQLLCDDILAIESQEGNFIAHPGYPQMKMWPEQARYFLNNWAFLEHVNSTTQKRRVPIVNDWFGEYCNHSVPVNCFYIANRYRPVDHAAIEIVAISPRDALLEFIRFSFVPRLVQASGYQPQRLIFFARLIREIPVRRVSYPSGFEYLSQVRDAIILDLENIRSLQ